MPKRQTSTKTPKSTPTQRKRTLGASKQTKKSIASKEKQWQLPEMLESHIDPLFRHRIYTTLSSIANATYGEQLETHLAINCNFQSDIYREEATRILFALSKDASLIDQYDPAKIIFIPDSILIAHDPHKAFQQQRHTRRQQFEDMISKLTADGDQASLRCRKCHQQIDVNSAQTRGADEPMTIFYNCLNPDCLHQGKM